MDDRVIQFRISLLCQELIEPRSDYSECIYELMALDA
jgi:hypothetical protein